MDALTQGITSQRAVGASHAAAAATATDRLALSAMRLGV